MYTTKVPLHSILRTQTQELSGNRTPTHPHVHFVKQDWRRRTFRKQNWRRCKNGARTRADPCAAKRGGARIQKIMLKSTRNPPTIASRNRAIGETVEDGDIGGQ